MHRSLSALAAIGAMLASCGGARLRTERASDAALLGAWAEETRDGPCPLEIEFFEDGTAEANHLNEDSPAKQCSFSRVPFRHTPDADPPRVELAGQLARCIYAREEGALRIACDEGEVLPRDMLYAIELRRIRVREVRGLPALVGSWLGPALHGEPERVRIADDGTAHFDGLRVRVEVHGATLDLVKPGGDERCRYRATERRITLHCRPAEEGYPETMLDLETPAGVMRTRILTRAPGEE